MQSLLDSLFQIYNLSDSFIRVGILYNFIKRRRCRLDEGRLEGHTYVHPFESVELSMKQTLSVRWRNMLYFFFPYHPVGDLLIVLDLTCLIFLEMCMVISFRLPRRPLGCPINITHQNKWNLI